MIKTLAIILALVTLVSLVESFSSLILSSRDSYASLGNAIPNTDTDISISNNNKVIILTFGNAPASQYIYAKPILDKYNFKGSFFIVCNWIDSEEGYKMKEPRMTWEQIETLHREGHDIQAKSMNHERLTEISDEELDYEIGEPKECLNEHNIDASIFGTPYGAGKDNNSVISTISKYYDFAITGFSDLMFLDCDGWKESSSLGNAA